MAEFGIFENSRSWGDFLTGLLAGLLCCLLLQPILIFTGVFCFAGSWSSVIAVLPRLLATAAFVAMLEEFLFRGVLLGFFRQFLAPSLAVLFSSLLFAGVHFVSFPKTAGGPVLWWSGLATLGEIGSGFPSWSLFTGSFLVLFAAGLILGWMTTTTGSLWAAIGLHGTWILGQQLFNSATFYRVKPPMSLMPLIGPSQCHGMVPTGLFPLACILLAGWAALLLLRRYHTGSRFPTVRGA
jgi:membrane protease YdiL (CAAX protease family)